MRQPGEESRIAALRMEGLAAGVLDAFTLEGVEASAPGSAAPAGAKGRLGRFTLRRLDLNQMSRLAAEAQSPSPLSALILFKVMSGLELSDLEVPHGDAPDAGPVRIGRLTLGWTGTRGGALPTGLDFTLSDVTGPIRLEDGEPFTYLVNAGMKQASISLALKAAYDADARTLTFAPVASEVKGAFRLNVETTVAEVPPSAFTDATGFVSAWPQAAAGPAKLTLTDLGLARLMVAQLAAAEGVSEDAYRQQVVELAEAIAADFATVSPDAAQVGAAVVSFLRQPGTLTITATPKGRVPLLALAATDDPAALLEAFTFTATAAP
ncbi:hypothetical protein ACI7BZ_20175 [Xanthobacter sp. AM11]|uniref:hypothetical protein n=1 Tax=Xanthobacter sp. AM11 TaxID=3380643 RepID=UPI0039BFF823